MIGERLCNITLGNVTIGVDAKSPGIMASILVEKHQSAPVETPIAVCAVDQDSYMTYLEDERSKASDDELQADTIELVEEQSKRPDNKVLMRVIKQLSQNGRIDDGISFSQTAL